MSFETWLAKCKSLIMSTLRFTEETAEAMIDGAGIEIYRRKFDSGLTPEHCIADELIYWNE